jgi:hypothetical protein
MEPGRGHGLLPIPGSPRPRSGGTSGRTGSRRHCGPLILLTGRFTFSGPPGVTPAFPVGVEAFDARTGNLLQAGGLPRLPARSAS